MASGRGAGSEFAVELLDSAKAAVACAKNHQQFVNESEAVIGRFCNALQRFKYQKYSDERQILEQIREKDALVHFLFDCVRNRFLYRDRVGQAKQHLTEGSAVWDKAFKDHLSCCETCRSVELRARETKATSDPAPASPGKFPIPHCLELLALGALLLPLFVWLKGGDCTTHWLWFLIAILLMLPLFALMFALRVRPGRGKMLSYFIAGRYSGTEHYRRLGIFWAPSHAQLLEPPASEDDAREKTCFSFGWWSRQSKLIDNTRVTVSEAVLTTDQDIIYPIKVSSDVCRWRLAPGELQADGSVTGLAREARFDGSSVEVLGPGGKTVLWTKIGCRRLDFIFKLTTVLAVVGLCALIAMLFFPPGLDFKCFSGATVIKRLPLRAVFLLDASGSIDNVAWNAEKEATRTIIDAFKDVYGSVDSGLLHLGLAQFNKRSYPVVNITSDIDSIVAKLSDMVQIKGGTEFKPALELCLEELDAYRGAGQDTFDVCVLITDGATDDQSLPVPADTALFGIYVGDSDKNAQTLRSFSTCGRANHSSSCHYFARAANFQDLKEKSHEVADNIAKGADSAGGKHEEPVEQPGYLPLFFLLLLPFLVWWVYLLYEKMPFRQGGNTSLEAPLRDPWRMRTVGMNEARTPEITPQISLPSRR